MLYHPLHATCPKPPTGRWDLRTATDYALGPGLADFSFQCYWSEHGGLGTVPISPKSGRWRFWCRHFNMNWMALS